MINELKQAILIVSAVLVYVYTSDKAVALARTTVLTRAHLLQIGQWETFQSGFERVWLHLCQLTGQIMLETSVVRAKFNLILNIIPRMVQS